jgi:predicted transcriptional regulator
MLRNHISETIRILESSIGGITKTKLMYSAYVSYSKVNQYVNLLILSGLLEYDSLDYVYRTTDKGISFLNTYKQIRRLHIHDL